LFFTLRISIQRHVRFLLEYKINVQQIEYLQHTHRVVNLAMIAFIAMILIIVPFQYLIVFLENKYPIKTSWISSMIKVCHKYDVDGVIVSVGDFE